MKVAIATIALTTALVSFPSFAETVAQNQAFNDLAIIGTYYLGQSFTVSGSGSFNNVVLNFYENGGRAAAPGTLFLYSSAYTGTPVDLGSGSGFLGSAVGSGGFYSFNPTISILSGAQYFAYSNAESPILEYSSVNPYAGGAAYQADAADGTFTSVEEADLRFRVDAVRIAAGVPEPGTWGLMIVGFGAVGWAMRRRPRTPTTVRIAA